MKTTLRLRPVATIKSIMLTAVMLLAFATTSWRIGCWGFVNNFKVQD